DLVNQTNTSYAIPTVAAAVSKTDLSTAAPGTTNANKWAYSLDDATYSPVPVNSAPTQIGSHDTPTAGTKTPVYIGMNVNVEKPSGVYKNQLTFSAVGNPITTDYSLYFLPGTTETVTGLPPTQTASVVAASHTFTIPSPAPTRSGYNVTGYSDGVATYQPGGTITVNGDIDYTGSATLTALWELASYTVTISNTNTSSGSPSISVPYGGSTTVTVTPSSGYYLSSVSCPSGYSCTGYNTGSTRTGTQTVTVTNNIASGGTLSFTGTALTLAQTCSNTAITSTPQSFTYSGVQYIKLKTNSAGTTGACYTKERQGVTTFDNASSLCPTSTRVPTQSDFNTLITAYNSSSSGALNSATGWIGVYWTSTQNPNPQSLYVHTGGATIGYNYDKTQPLQIICIAY
ncbi:hypothetical protein J6S39_02030, partial [Candidatus Saccharibacteria bacterium]|nr:hypothetical protein [Candidatus Saccharibacteria bacterium]